MCSLPAVRPPAAAVRGSGRRVTPVSTAAPPAHAGVSHRPCRTVFQKRLPPDICLLSWTGSLVRTGADLTLPSVPSGVFTGPTDPGEVCREDTGDRERGFSQRLISMATADAGLSLHPEGRSGSQPHPPTPAPPAEPPSPRAWLMQGWQSLLNLRVLARCCVRTKPESASHSLEPSAPSVSEPPVPTAGPSPHQHDGPAADRPASSISGL